MPKDTHPRDRFRAVLCVCAVLITTVALITTLAAAIVESSAMRIPTIAITGAAAIAWLASGVEGVIDWRAMTADTRAKNFGGWYAGVNLAALAATSGAAVGLVITSQQVALLPLGCLTLAAAAGASALALCVVIRNDLAAAARLRRQGSSLATTQSGRRSS